MFYDYIHVACRHNTNIVFMTDSVSTLLVLRGWAPLPRIFILATGEEKIIDLMEIEVAISLRHISLMIYIPVSYNTKYTGDRKAQWWTNNIYHLIPQRCSLYTFLSHTIWHLCYMVADFCHVV